MSPPPVPLAMITTTDLAAITRGRAVPTDRLAAAALKGVAWVPANLCLTAFGTIPAMTPWGSRGDLRLMPDLPARSRTTATGRATPFDMVPGDLVELDGTPWDACPRTALRTALADFKAASGLTVTAAFEQEFQLVDSALPEAHAFSLAALRRADPFASQLMAALEEASAAPELVIPEYGRDQYEVVCAPADALVAADRAIVIREATRELAASKGWRASFVPKTAPDAVGNGVHVHISLRHADGSPATYDPAGTGGLSEAAARFCAGVLRHMPALLVFTAPSVVSYLRLMPHSWSASYTSLALQDREAALRICPGSSIGGGDRAVQYNIEYRAADATANPHLALAAIIRAGLEGLAGRLEAPSLTAGDPEAMSAAERERLGLRRLPRSLDEALVAFAADATARRWFAPRLVDSMLAVRRTELEAMAGCDAGAITARYGRLY